jgi:hypothetical protein
MDKKGEDEKLSTRQKMFMASIGQHCNAGSGSNGTFLVRIDGKV